jgi:hypothetical protein
MKNVFENRNKAEEHKNSFCKTPGYLEIEKFGDSKKSFYIYVIPKSSNAVWIAVVPMFDIDFLDGLKEFNREQLSLFKKMMPVMYDCWNNGLKEYFHKYSLLPITDPDTEGKRWCLVSVVGNLDNTEMVNEHMFSLFDNRANEMLSLLTQLMDEMVEFPKKVRNRKVGKALGTAGNLAWNFLIGFIKGMDMYNSGLDSDTYINQRLTNMELPDVYINEGFHLNGGE